MGVMPVARIGSGAGFAGDRVQPAADLAEHGELDDLVLECLAERTIALGQAARRADPTRGCDPRLEERFRVLLPIAARSDVRIVTNMGAANPMAAGVRTAELLSELGLGSRRVAVVSGDDVLDRIDRSAPALEDGRPLHDHGEIVSANAYLGADAVLPALAMSADIVITGRVADPSLFVAPLVDRLGWDLCNSDQVAAATLVGHLLECAGQVSGGYFADPGYKPVPDLADLGFPFADVSAGGTATLGKWSGSGGCISVETVREQLLYEITDPAAYATPDTVLDLREVRLRATAPDRDMVAGARGRGRPESLKVSVGYLAGWRAEAEISYFGANAERRARLAGEIVLARVDSAKLRLRAEILNGLSSTVMGVDDGEKVPHCRLRVAALGETAHEADAVCHEVEALYTNGPAGGAGVRGRAEEVIGIVSTLLPRDAVTPQVAMMEMSHAS
jgi:hypothetical protein